MQNTIYNLADLRNERQNFLEREHTFMKAIAK